MAAGYSNKTLVQKLGIKPGFEVYFFNLPEHYFELLEDLPGDITFGLEEEQSIDFIHYFCQELAQLVSDFPMLKETLKPTGMLWISWPKGSSKIATDLNENVIREVGLAQGLVDVKVAAIDEDWSGLKFVYRLTDR